MEKILKQYWVILEERGFMFQENSEEQLNAANKNMINNWDKMKSEIKNILPNDVKLIQFNYDYDKDYNQYELNIKIEVIGENEEETEDIGDDISTKISDVFSKYNIYIYGASIQED